MANNIISVILGGKLILIEGVAHEKVKAYLADLTNFYASDINKIAKVQDAENRLALLFHQKLQNGTNYINIEDVDHAIAQEPIPEGFKTSQAEGASSTSFTDDSYYRKKLYRNDSDKKLGGICSGIAHWLNIDPNIVRILVAIIIFSSIGFGLLLYILAWIFLPSKYLGPYNGRVLFRNPDNKVFGGVCSGLAAYFKTHVSTVRLIVALPLMLTIIKSIKIFSIGPDLGDVFGMISGTFTGFTITAYIILWIVLPEAITVDQKKNMYNSTKKNNDQFEQSMNDIKDRMGAWGNEAKDSIQNLGKQFQQNTEHISKNMPHYGRSVGQSIGAVIGGIFKAIFFVIVGTIAVTLFILLISLLFSGIAWSSVNHYLWTNDTQMYLAWGTLILFVVVPVIGLFVWIYRRISSGRSLNNNHLGWSFGGLWALGWVFLMFFLVDVSKEFRYKESVSQEQSFKVQNNSSLLVKVSRPELAINAALSFSNGGNSSGMHGVFFDDDSLKVGMAHIIIEKSEDSLYHVVLKKQAMGSSMNDAKKRAENLVFQYTVKDSVLDLANGWAIAKGNAYRMQNVVIQIKVPVGKTIVVDKSVRHKLNNVNVGVYNDEYNSSWTELGYIMSNEKYMMQENGSLKNLEIQESMDEEDPVDVQNYRWEDDEDRLSHDTIIISHDTVKKGRNGYRFDVDSNAMKDVQTQKIIDELEQKQKEIEALKEKLKKHQ